MQNRLGKHRRNWLVFASSLFAATLYLTLCWFTLVDIDSKEVKFESITIDDEYEQFDSIAQDHLQNEIIAEKNKIHNYIQEYSCSFRSLFPSTFGKLKLNAKELTDIYEFVNKDSLLSSPPPKTIVQIQITSLNPLRAFLLNSTIPTAIETNIFQALLAIDYTQSFNQPNEQSNQTICLSLIFEGNQLIEIKSEDNHKLQEVSSIEKCDKKFNETRKQFADELYSLFENDSVGVVGVHCDQSHTVCIDSSDIKFVLDSLLQKQLFDHKLLFPIFESFDELFEQTMISLSKQVKAKHYSTIVYKTESIHALLRMIKLPEKGLIGLESQQIELVPSFTQSLNHYQVNRKAFYEEIKIEFNVSLRNSSIKFDDSEKIQNKTLTFTLGIGSNRILLPIYDQKNNHLKTYLIDIVRENRKATADSKTILQTCDFYQDCQMQVLDSIHICGTQNATEYSCTEHGIGGRWRVQCENCQMSTNCDWNSATWLPNKCEKRQQNLNRDNPESCLTNWKIMFVGDSTNRGIFHRTVELLNGSLTDGAKTHDETHVELSSNIHAEFHYYPKFWIEQDRRPTFEQVIEGLKLHNRSDRIALIVGGAQWLDVKHVYFLQSYKERFGLKNLHLVIKGLGSGFHQAVSGIHHHLSIDNLRELTKHNENIVHAAHKCGMFVLDTWAQTISRFRDFYPGKCSCHFHQLIKTSTGFHVIGDINNLAVESLFTQLCDTSTIP